jgi:chromate transporter
MAKECTLAPVNPQPQPAREVAALFLKLGCIAFGGPAAHIAMMRDEVVKRRRWVSDQEFLDLLSAANLIPGPSSTELAIFLGYRRAGVVGLVLGGTLFILPAMAIVLALAWAYVQFGTAPAAGWLLYGIKPAVIAIIVQALWGLGRTAVKGVVLAFVGAAVLGFYLRGANVIVLLIGAGVLMVAIANRSRLPFGRMASVVTPAAVLQALDPGTVSLGLLFGTFLKIGAVVFGSGYVLLAYLRAEFVEQLHWLTNQQILDAVAVGQFTPGPVFTTATFIGYVLAGIPGALLATLGIFLPGFVFVAIVYPFVPRLRGSEWSRAFLDGVNVSALGLMAGITWQLGRTAITDRLTATIAVCAAILLIRYRLNSAWLVAGGGLIGIVAHTLGAAV